MSELEYSSLSFGEDANYSLEDEKIRSSLTGMYQRVFNESVYGENFDYEMADSVVEDLGDRDFEGFLALDEGVPVGFGWGYRLEPEEQEEFPAGLSDEFFDGETFYFAELGVLPDYRDQGIGKEIKSREVEKAEKRDDISRGLMRTSIEQENQKKLGLDRDLGFQPADPIPGTEIPVVESLDLIGTEGQDVRGYFWREL